MKNKKGKGSGILHKCLVFTCIAVFLVFAFGYAVQLTGLSARFVTRASGGDSARVARFDITEKTSMEQTFAVEMKPGESKDITVEIVNKRSEVAMDYDIILDLEGNLPLSANLTKSSNSAVALTKVNGANAYEWSGKVEANATNSNAESTSTYTFSLLWSKDDNSYKYSEGVESVTVSITAVQEE